MSAIFISQLTACVTAPPAFDADALIAEAEAADIAAIRAQSDGDLATLGSYLSEDYAYIDISGNRVAKADILARRRRTSGR